MRRGTVFCLRIALLALGVALAAGCRSATPKITRTGPVHSNVLVVVNDKSPDSVTVGYYYAGRRNIPEGNILHVKCETGEKFSKWIACRDGLFLPVQAYLAKDANKTRIDYIVLTRGIPFRSEELGPSVDSVIELVHNYKSLEDMTPNPFFDASEPFSSKKYGFYLVTRLDGRTLADAKRLVDLSLKAKPAKGIFLFDQDPTRNVPGYQDMNVALEKTSKELADRGFEVRLDKSSEFVGWQKNLAGYFSWGSNDKFYSRVKYRSNTFVPGAIADTAVSTSARTMADTSEGQSLIADLIAAGITGVKGYPGEPRLAGISWPPILFDRYTRGWNLADSFYAASRFIKWRDVVFGDPLCAPYAGTK